MHKRAREKADKYFFSRVYAKSILNNSGFYKVDCIQRLVGTLQHKRKVVRKRAKKLLKFIRKLDKQTYKEVINAQKSERA